MKNKACQLLRTNIKKNYFRYFPNTAMYHVQVMLRKISKLLNYKKELKLQHIFTYQFISCNFTMFSHSKIYTSANISSLVHSVERKLVSTSGPECCHKLYWAQIIATCRKLVSSSHVFLFFQCSYINYKYYKYLQ